MAQTNDEPFSKKKLHQKAPRPLSSYTQEELNQINKECDELLTATESKWIQSHMYSVLKRNRND